jgi:myo-inositol-1(or 4)-monophosphatase
LARRATKNKHRFAITQSLAERVERIRMFGSAALDLAFVAEGRTDGCVILANKPSDSAAGVSLAPESGEVVKAKEVTIKLARKKLSTLLPD